MMRYAIGTLFLLVSLCTNGQSYKLFTTDRELSSSLINEIYQDRDGMVWIATEDGLTRYDGAKFVTYKHEEGNAHSLCHNYVCTLCEVSDGRLLIGTYNGVQLYDPDTDSFSGLAICDDGQLFDSNISSFLKLKDGSVWVSGSSLCSVTINADSVLIHPLQLSVPTRFTGYLLEDRQGNKWVMQGENGIYRLSPDNKVEHFLSDVKGVAIKALYEDDYGVVYVGTLDKGLLKYDAKAGQFITIPGTEKLPIKYVGRKSQDECYLCTDGRGIWVYNIQERTVADYPFGNNYFDSHTSKVHYILEDHAGNLWIAIYQKGVMMFPEQSNNFQYLGYKSVNENIIGSNCITSIFRDHEGVLWVGTDNDGIYGVTRDLKQKVHYVSHSGSHSVPSTVFGLYEDSRNDLWFGSYTCGLGKLDRRTGRCDYLNLFDTDGNKVQRVYDFIEDNDNRLWIATMGAGLFYYDLKTGKAVYDVRANTPEVKYDWITSLLYTRDNHLYVGSYGGLKCIDLNSPQFTAKEFLSRHIVFSLYEDRYGNVWTGLSDGLAKLNPQTDELTVYTSAQGLPTDAVYAIQGDAQDNLWIITNAGMSRFNMQTGRFTNYYVDDGLQGNEFSKNASFADKDGTLWFGGMSGITYFKPGEIVGLAKHW
ncbi:MAG: hybrid sensor histidine kinase/response regulator, partial [Prevotellaceae bacterium]|nr:hybrid sensor histidine kinase/response regulator [Prevotellaceae bacterium]